MSLIEVKNLFFRYEGRKAQVLSGVDLRVEKGETVLLLGPSGSGKSTLALCLNGLIPHAVAGEMEGAVHIAGLDTRTAPVSELTRKVGTVFQDPEAQFVTMRVEDEVAFGLENLCVLPEEIDGRIEEALSKVGMEGMRQRPVDALSGGYKQRLALASVLAMRPEVLVFDEPTANLDPASTREFFAAVEALKAGGGYTIVLIEHKLDRLMHLIDRVVVLDAVSGADGANLTDGPPRKVFRRHAPELVSRGVWMPQVSLLAYRLRKERDVKLDPFPVTLDEAEEALVGKLPAGPSASPNGSWQKEPRVRSPEDVTAIEVQNLSFSYGGNQVLSNIGLSVEEGDFLAVVGANGAGKTTLARHLVGLLRPTSGSVELGGRDIGRVPARELVREASYVFQNPEHQFVTDLVEEEVSFGLRLLGLPEEEVSRRTWDALDRFGLHHHAKANPFTLSHGEKRRLSVATMLVVGQKILVLDEPTFGQDQKNAEELLGLLGELNGEGKTIIVVTHDMALVAGHTENVAVLSEGELRYHGPTGKLFAQPSLLREARLEPPPLVELSARLSRSFPLSGETRTTGDELLEAFALTPAGRRTDRD